MTFRVIEKIHVRGVKGPLVATLDYDTYKQAEKQMLGVEAGIINALGKPSASITVLIGKESGKSFVVATKHLAAVWVEIEEVKE